MLKSERLNQNDLLLAVKINNIVDDTIPEFVLNVRSLSKQIDVIASLDKILNNDVTGFTKTQINLSDSTTKIIKRMDFFNINFINSEV